ncbi:MAG: hypothetical protein ACXW2I_15495 [Burkholderiales bacterium]
MTPADGIRKLGFRRWYERQLIEGHVYFVTCFLSMILVAACLEQIDWRAVGQEFALFGYIVGGFTLCLFSLRRYHFLLLRAECFGNQSTCGNCLTYGILQVIDAGIAETDANASDVPRDNSWIRVRCKKCGHEWRMDRKDD